MEVNSKLIDWLNKTGYPLELWAESIFSKFKFNTMSSALYKDNENSLFREVDLIAERNWMDSDKKVVFSIKFLIECKKSEKPFILLENSKGGSCKISFGEYYGISDYNSGLAINNPYKKIGLPNKSKNGFKLIQGFTNGDEVAHKAINTLIKSFMDYEETEKEIIDSYIKENVNLVCFPILLIDAPFYSLKTDIENDLEIEEIDTAVVNTYSNLWKFHPLSPFPLSIIKKSSLESFLMSVEEFALLNLDFLIKNPLNNIKHFNQRKIDIIPSDRNIKTS